MARIRPDITLIRGDSNSIIVNFDGVDLTGATVFFTAKSVLDTADDTSADIAIEVTEFDDPTSGEVIIPLTPEDTTVDPGDYFYDVQVKDSDGNIKSIPYRKLTVVADVTRRTTA